MTKKEKAAEIASRLDQYIGVPQIPLSHKDPFTLLVAVLLSAQCTDERVNKVTPLLFELADNPWDMALLSVERIQGVIKSCGLSETKAKAINNLSRILVEKYEGKVPDNLEKLELLPGVGHKTASVVLCQVFGQAAFPVDTHIHRLAWRWKLSNGKNVTQTEKDLKLLFPRENWAKIHLQMIYFGRMFCPARSHDPRECPICRDFGRKELFKKDS